MERKFKICIICKRRHPLINTVEDGPLSEVEFCDVNYDIHSNSFCPEYRNWNTGLPGKPGIYPDNPTL